MEDSVVKTCPSFYTTRGDGDGENVGARKA